MLKEQGNLKEIIDYYQEAERKYQNWGKDEEREGIYALHCGYIEEGQVLTHLQEIKQLTKKFIDFMQIPHMASVLDAGCGTGAVSFELANQHKDAKVIGINISENQLQTANLYKIFTGLNSVYFLAQDYHHLAFPQDTFDVVFFCESYTHSWNKFQLSREVFRVLKPSGKFVLSDIFTKRKPKDENEQLVMENLMKGWYLPTIQEIQEFTDNLKTMGFYNIYTQEHTDNIIDSSKRMRVHAELKLSAASTDSYVLNLSKKAVVGCNEALEKGMIGYYFVRGTKNDVDFK